MSTSCLALVGAGPLPELLLQRFSKDVADLRGSTQITAAMNDDPDAVLSDCTRRTGLLCLNGDAARLLPRGSSWLEAMADWRMPTLLLALADADGEMPGHAAAHAALCRQLHVPLVGLVQLQGHWDASARRRDGLPWCGWVPDTDHPRHEDGLDALVERISRGRFTEPVARAAV